MNPLRTLENMIAGLVEGTFGRVFRSEVRPMELAHKLAREMDENTTVSVSRVYAPNEYSIWLSPRDRERYEGVEEEVIEELCAYLLEHARAEDFAIASGPQISFHTDEDLQLGEFGIEARLARSEIEEREPAEPAASATAPPPPVSPRRREVPVATEPAAVGNTMIFSNAERVREAVQRSGSRRPSKALLVLSGRRTLLPPRGAAIGRSRDCDIVLEDAGVSRRHAELRPVDACAWSIEDLGSTNGVRVNGQTIAGAHELRSGDRIAMGSTEMVFEIAP
ncbi:MAG: FhaA domain-containing protein [Solirubrobacteraceae bacterium]